MFFFFLLFVLLIISFRLFVFPKVLKLKPNDRRKQYGSENKVGVKLFEPME